MKTRVLPALMLAGVVLLSLSSCIVGDELVTLIIHPDGSAEWLRVRTNLRSTEEGDRGAEELRRYADAFDARRDPDLVRVREAGGEILDAHWLRSQEPPYANIVRAKLPRASALEAFSTYENDNGETLVETRFTRDGKGRQLSIRIAKNDQLAASLRRTESERRRERANGVSETRVAVAGGRIISARGFAVASDRRSALLDLREIAELLEAGEGQATLLLEWEVSGD